MTKMQQYFAEAKKYCAQVRTAAVDKIVAERREAFLAMGGKLYQTLGELEAVAAFMEERGGARGMVDVGGAYGGSLYVLAPFVVKGSLLVSVFLEQGYFTRPSARSATSILMRVVRTLRDEGWQVVAVRANSQCPQTAMRVRGLFRDTPPEMVYIDADHLYPGVVADFGMYRSMLDGMGMMVFHDVMERPGVKDFWWGMQKYVWATPGKDHVLRTLVGEGDHPCGTGVLFNPEVPVRQGVHVH